MDDFSARAAPVGAESDTPFAPPSEEKIQRSLFGEILDWMLVPLLLLWPISIAFTYVSAKSIADRPFDHMLEGKLTVLAQQVREIDGKKIAPLPRAAVDILRADDTDMLYYQIVGPAGDHIDGDRELPPPARQEDIQVGRVQFRDVTVHGTTLRIAHTYVDLRATAADWEMLIAPRMALVQLAESLDKRGELAGDIIKGVILPQFIILPVALALIWMALSRGLSPLAELQRRIRARRPDDLSPIDAGQVPEEITPLVGSLNDLLARLSQTIDAQKRFIADAAHQMKTPLAGMRMQSELALRQTSQDEIHRSLEQLAKSSDSATRLVNQLLALARAEHRQPAAKPLCAIDLSALARDVVHDWVQASFTHRIDLGFEQADQPAVVDGDPVMLRELLSNLIDNALRYTPERGLVTVRVRIDPERGWPLLEVEDTGPGIAPAERSRVFERFYRILGSNVQGSGLGLAIVREIATHHGAEIDIFNNPRSQDPKWPGCLIRVSFPNACPFDAQAQSQ